jgi:hypothetical protein
MLATGCDLRALALRRFHRDLRLEHRSGDRPYLRKDGQRGRGHRVEVWSLEDRLNKPVAPREELLDDEVMVHGVPPDEQG